VTFLTSAPLSHVSCFLFFSTRAKSWYTCAPVGRSAVRTRKRAVADHRSSITPLRSHFLPTSSRTTPPRPFIWESVALSSLYRVLPRYIRISLQVLRDGRNVPSCLGQPKWVNATGDEYRVEWSIDFERGVEEIVTELNHVSGTTRH
jgi:hypothetical protein